MIKKCKWEWVLGFLNREWWRTGLDGYNIFGKSKERTKKQDWKLIIIIVYTNTTNIVESIIFVF